MKGKWDDFIEDMVSYISPSKVDPKSENLNEIGKKMEEEVKKAFDSASGNKEAAPEKKPEPDEDPEENDDDVDDMNDEREDN